MEVEPGREGGEAETDPMKRHVGTRDIDLGFAVGLVEEGRYTEITTRLARCGFVPDRNEKGNLTPQRWRHDTSSELTIDFLISPTREEEEGGSIKHLEENLSAIIIPGSSWLSKMSSRLGYQEPDWMGLRPPRRFRSAGRERLCS
jgi:hypothetical protein